MTHVYKVFYREKRKKDGHLFETSLTGKNIKEATQYARDSVKGTKFTVVSVTREQ